MIILQSRLPHAPWADSKTRRLPGIQPVGKGEWLHVDDAYAPQMAERDRLIETVPQGVHALLPGALPAARELLDLVLNEVAGMAGFAVASDHVIRPDGVSVALDREAPLLVLGRIVQEDFCILQPGDAGEHVMTGAILCFPASWTLSEKIGHPLTRIHDPVMAYDRSLAQRVQRLFDAIRPGQPLWRANALAYADATLHQPRPESDRRPQSVAAPYIRSERQSLVRLPMTGAVVFSIHTYVVARESLTAEQAEALREHPLDSA